MTDFNLCCVCLVAVPFLAVGLIYMDFICTKSGYLRHIPVSSRSSLFGYLGSLRVSLASLWHWTLSLWLLYGHTYGLVAAANVSRLWYFKLITLSFHVTVCKKDLKRTDYRKADKMRPGIWYLILAVAYLIISCWSTYFVCTMYVAVNDTIC